MGASGSLIEPPSQPVVKIVEAIYKANCNIKMNSIMIPPKIISPPSRKATLPASEKKTGLKTDLQTRWPQNMDFCTT